jgi:hypothetical protein
MNNKLNGLSLSQAELILNGIRLKAMMTKLNEDSLNDYDYLCLQLKQIINYLKEEN